MHSHPETKTCQQCGGDFARRYQERPYRWNERRFCSSRCANFHRRKESDLPPCRRCQRKTGRNRVRGLCGTCYEVLLGTDELLDYPRLTIPSDVVWDEWCLLRGQGLKKIEVANMLGMTYAALDRTLCRVRARMRKEGTLT